MIKKRSTKHTQFKTKGVETIETNGVEKFEIGLELNFTNAKLVELRDKTDKIEKALKNINNKKLEEEIREKISIEILKTMEPVVALYLMQLVNKVMGAKDRRVTTKIKIFSQSEFTLDGSNILSTIQKKYIEPFKKLTNKESITKTGYLFTVYYYTKKIKKTDKEKLLLEWKFTYDTGVIEIIIKKQSWQNYKILQRELQDDIFSCMKGNGFTIDGLHTHLNLDFDTVFEKKVSYVLCWARDQERIKLYSQGYIKQYNEQYNKDFNNYLNTLYTGINKYHSKKEIKDYNNYLNLGVTKVTGYFTINSKEVSEYHTKKLREYFNSPYMWEINSIVLPHIIKDTNKDYFEMSRIIGFCMYHSHKICFKLDKLNKPGNKNYIYIPKKLSESIKEINTAIENLSYVFEKEDKNFNAITKFYNKLAALCDKKIETESLKKICSDFEKILDKAKISEIFKLSLLTNKKIKEIKEIKKQEESNQLETLKNYFTIIQGGLGQLRSFYNGVKKDKYVTHIDTAQKQQDLFLKYRCINITNIENINSDLQRVEHRGLRSKDTFKDTIKDVDEILNSIYNSKKKFQAYCDKKDKN